MKNKTVLGIAY